ncbi:MAG: bifunctional phosphoglucose/phosphomannose isomerase [Patescibacteria group bacterium]
MREAIINFPEQFDYEPVIENEDALKKAKRFAVVGMGGSGLAGDLLRGYNSRLDVIVHKNYGLPVLADGILEKSLIVLSSYSGDTEEVLGAYQAAKEKRLATAAISLGGKLLEQAKADGIPYIQLPDTGIEPRLALGFSFRALAKIIGEKNALKESGKLAGLLKPEDFEEKGKKLAEKIKGFTPLVYSSEKNQAAAYNWKIRFNETARIPAFCNVFPELNHNELAGFDFQESTKELSRNFYFIFLKDSGDHPRIAKRMEVMEAILRDKKMPVENINLEGKNFLHKIFSSITLADWTSYYLAQEYGLAGNSEFIVEKFKKLILD